jgi:hypothetical protein
MQCICLCSTVLMMHVRMTRVPIWWVSDSEDNQRQRRIWVASCFLTTKIPSALLVAVVWLQHTRFPRLRRGTFSYGMTTSPNTKDRVGDIENTPSVCMLVHPRFPMHMPCKCTLKKRHNYFFILQKVVSKTMRIGLRWKVRSNQDKDINTKNTLVLQHVWGHGLKENTNRRKWLDDRRITIEDWILRSRHSHWHSRIA